MSGSTFEVYWCEDCERLWTKKRTVKCSKCRKPGRKMGFFERNTFGKTP